MHKTLLKVKKKRLAELVENIIKKMNKNEILQSVQAESSLLAPQFRNPDLVGELNIRMLDFLSVPILTGKHQGEMSGAIATVEGAYKVLKNIIKKNVKLKKPLDKKSLDALFYLHVYDLALIASEKREVRKLLKIKKGFFGQFDYMIRKDDLRGVYPKWMMVVWAIIFFAGAIYVWRYSGILSILLVIGGWTFLSYLWGAKIWGKIK